ncbi:hypothetical protein Lal_00029148 [Lupinus albus]|nr:hypothetical protein Lal_00029148 [Lupinus albus]
MKPFKKHHFLHSLLMFNVILGSSIAHHNHKNNCGNFRTQTHFLNQNSSISSLLDSITLCRSQNLYFRTSLGLFQVSSVDYNARVLTISHSSCSSSLQYVSPLAITAGFPSPPQPNSLILFNCSSRRDSISPFMQNCIYLYKCGSASSPTSRIQEQEKSPYSCLVAKDLLKLDKDFHPEHLNCSHYSWIHRSSLNDGDYEGYKLGTRISFDMPNHVADICKECKRVNGSCGAGLKCLCHAKECTDKVINKARSIKSTGSVFLSLLCFLSSVSF